uniref:Uncharacterized protein n=1 Tax=Anguilla anguilla TaxID=7936 RepID=A0A0E9RBG1_ANGAN
MDSPALKCKITSMQLEHFSADATITSSN